MRRMGELRAEAAGGGPELGMAPRTLPHQSAVVSQAQASPHLQAAPHAQVSQAQGAQRHGSQGHWVFGMSGLQGSGTDAREV